MGNPSHSNRKHRAAMDPAAKSAEKKRADYIAAIIKEQYREVITEIAVQWEKDRVLFVMQSDEIEINLPLARKLIVDEMALPDLQILRLAGLAILGVFNALVDEMAVSVLSL